MKIERTEFHNLFNIVYDKRLLKEKVDELFDLLDEDKREYIVIIPSLFINYW